MADRLHIKAISDSDRDWVRQAAALVFGRYTGGLHRWHFPNTPEMWKIHFGARAGVVGVHIGGRRGCIKLFYDNRLHVKLRNWMGISKAQRAFHKGLELARRHISCPAIFGWAVDYRTGLALLATELIEDAQRVDMQIQQCRTSTEQIRRMAAFVRHMHDAGVAHNDLSLRNILTGQRNGQACFWLLDYEDAVFASTASYAMRIQNLHHLNERALGITEIKDRLFFLKCYLQENRQVKQWTAALRDYMRRHPSKYTVSYREDCRDE